MRDGVPLPGSTPAAVLSQLAHRVFGPFRPDRVRVMLDFHGLAGRPATSAVDVGDRHHIHPTTVANWAKTLAAAGACRRRSPGVAETGRDRLRPTYA